MCHPHFPPDLDFHVMGTVLTPNNPVGRNPTKMNFDDDFERELTLYSEIGPESEEAVQPVPQTIQRYKQKIQLNNNVSIFDADYSLPVSNGVNSHDDDDDDVLENSHDKLFNDDGVIQVVSGRGRGGRNTFHRPGKLNEANDVDEVTRQIRKVAPVGYGNEITEITVQAHHKSKLLKQQSSSSSPALSNSSISPSLLVGAPVESMQEMEDDAEVKSNSSSSSKGRKLLVSETSGLSTPDSKYSDVESSDYFTSQELGVADGYHTVENLEESSGESENQDTEDANLCNENSQPPRLPDTKPISITEMLRRSRAQYKQRQLERQINQALQNSIQVPEPNKLATHLCQDQRKIYLSDRSSSSSVASVHSQDDTLPWRRRTNSPPKYQWGQDHRKKGMLNINSSVDFPPLK